MGVFSFVTSDTNRSIPLVGCGDDSSPQKVYMLRPNAAALIEDCYGGYGVFGGVDVYEWVAETNAEHLGIDVTEWTEQERRVLGIFLSMGRVYRDKGGQLWAVFYPNYSFFERYGIKVALGNYGQPVDSEVGEKTPNDYLASGEWVEIAPEALGMVKYHIKLSEREVDYFSVEKSEDCPHQGILTEEEYED